MRERDRRSTGSMAAGAQVHSGAPHMWLDSVARVLSKGSGLSGNLSGQEWGN